MSLPYVYTPRPGEWVSVRRDDVGACSVGAYGNEYGLAMWVRIPAVNVPAQAAGIATAMHEAAGLPAPVILERPEVSFRDGLNRAGPFEVGRLRDRVTVGLYGIQPEEIEPDVARRLAALIAIRADEAQACEPDPAEVHALALVLSDGTSPTDEDRMNARTVLRAGYRREAKP